MVKRKRSGTKSKIYSKGRTTLPCRKCGRAVDNVSADAIGVECSSCLNLAVPCTGTVVERSEPIGPRGWHLRKVFVTTDGTVYHKGVEQPKLKGTLPPTKIKKKTVAEKRKKLEDADKKILKAMRTVDKRGRIPRERK